MLRTKRFFVIVIGVAAATLPILAQTQERDADRGYRLSLTLQKKVAERLAQSPFPAAGDVTGPIVDRVTRDWTMEAADCSLVKAQVKFTGVKRNTLYLTPNGDGTYYFELHRDASGTAADATGNKYVFLYNQVLALDITEPGLTETAKATGTATDTLQLIPLTSAGTGYSLAAYLKVDTPTLVSGPLPAPTSTGPLGCNPF
jgi:hypothetical protein